jgi:hypothetical protein
MNGYGKCPFAWSKNTQHSDECAFTRQERVTYATALRKKAYEAAQGTGGWAIAQLGESAPMWTGTRAVVLPYSSA